MTRPRFHEILRLSQLPGVLIGSTFRVARYKTENSVNARISSAQTLQLPSIFAMFFFEILVANRRRGVLDQNIRVRILS